MNNNPKKSTKTRIFKYESEYQSYLCNKIMHELEIDVRAEYRCEKGYVDIYIPFVNALIECKIEDTPRLRKQAEDQLVKYNMCFKSRLLFVATPDSNDETFIIQKLKPVIERKRRKIKRILTRYIDELKSVDLFSLSKDVAYEKNARAIDLGQNMSTTMEGAFFTEEEKIIRAEIGRINNDWFRYQYINKIFKPKCVLNSNIHEYWEHPSANNLFLVKTGLSTAFYDHENQSFFLIDKCGTDCVYDNFEQRKLSCLGDSCVFRNGFTIEDTRIRLTESIGDTSSYKLQEEAWNTLWLLHPTTEFCEKEYLEDCSKNKNSTYSPSVFDYLTNQDIFWMVYNANKDSIAFQERFEFWNKDIEVLSSYSFLQNWSKNQSMAWLIFQSIRKSVKIDLEQYFGLKYL